MAEVDLLDFVRECKRLAEQASGKHAGEPATGGFARCVHVVIHCFRIEDEHSYRKTENRLKHLASHLYEDPIGFVHEAVYTLISVPQRPRQQILHGFLQRVLEIVAQ